MSTSSKSTMFNATPTRRALTIVGAAALTAATFWLYILLGRKLGAAMNPYYSEQDVADYWILPGISAMIGCAVTYLLLLCVAWTLEYIRKGPEQPEYKCTLGRNCPCVDHQQRLDDEESHDHGSGLAVGIATGTATGIAIGMMN